MARRIAALVVMLFAIFVGGVDASAETITSRDVSGFYPEEVWRPGKIRRWMREEGSVEVANGGGALRVDLGFYMESFRVPRSVEVLLDGVRVGVVRAPAGAQMFHVLRDLRLPAGPVLLTFRSLSGVDRISTYLGGSDRREVSVALGPLRILPSDSPQAKRMQPSAFPGPDTRLAFLSPEENDGHELRREGRLLEAWDKLAPVARVGRAHAITYPLAGIVALALDDLEGAREMFDRGKGVRGWDPLSVQARRMSGALRAYLDRSELIAQRSQDPALLERRRGEVYRAVPRYRAVMARRPCEMQAAYWLGILLALAEQGKEAGEQFRCVLEERPDSADARMLLELGKFFPAR